jgi:hypothetical protein
MFILTLNMSCIVLFSIAFTIDAVDFDNCVRTYILKKTKIECCNDTEYPKSNSKKP